ncbi:MAG: hypothetical protein Q9209_000350 [Squamulea sp. 1 TL-2023]
MVMPITGTSGTDVPSKINHESLPEIPDQVNNISLNDKRPENSATSEPLDQGPKATRSNDDGVHDSNCRVQYIKSVLDDNGDRREEQSKRISTTMLSSKEDSHIAFVVKQIWDKNKTMTGTEIVLRGQELREIMHNVLAKPLEHEQDRDWLKQEQTIDDDTTIQWYYWNELSNAAKSNLGSELGRQDLQLLLDHLSELFPEDVKLARTMSSMTKVVRKDLWCLFKPGTLVISKPYQDEPQFFRVHGFYGSEPFVVEAWAFSWTGTELIQEYYEFRIGENRKGDEEMTITDLPCYPIRYYKNRDGLYGPEALEALKTSLIARGKKFHKLCKESVEGKQHTYEGELLYEPQTNEGAEDNWSQYSWRWRYLEGTYDRTKLKKGTTASIFSSNCAQWIRRFDKDAAGNDSANEDSNYLLLPARLLGYFFNDKAWAQFHVDRIKPIETSDAKKLMEKLVFPSELGEVKDDLKTLIEQHGNTKRPLVVDPVGGKGAGLVVLLHGVGKTLTAEILAKCAGKPLYHVGASDIGVDPRLAEIALRRIFELAERWGAVLLIDEADVFIDSRGTKGEADLSKNALVSVMLRVLEYFKGILIMTTNRVMTFDVAMLSRCHYTVHFKSLTLQQEKDIWIGYVNQLTDKNSSDIPQIRSWVNQITKKRTKLSGREIRNVFTTAQTLAQATPNQKITKDHLERVYDRLVDFLDAMEKSKTEQQARLNALYS